MSVVMAWLLTYLLHSTVLLGAAAVVRLVLRERRLALQEAVLRAALVGGFVTASLQLGVGLQPLGGVLAVPEAQVAQKAAARTEVVYGALPAVLDDVQPRRVASRQHDGAAGLPGPATWGAVVMGLWGALALLGLTRLNVAAVRLKRLLRPRHHLAVEGLSSRVAALSAGLGLRRPVPVSTAPRLQIPLATGVVRPEVWLPERALRELETDQQEALCAHELAHVARRDPTWILVARVAEAVAPLQPLNTWARQRLQDLAECLSDDLAVAASGRRDGLARSLVDVASWTVSDAVPLPAVALGAVSARRSRLGHRVERLMDPLRTLERPRRFLLPLAAACVLATALVTPAVSGGTTEAEPPVPPAAPAPPEPPAVPAVPEIPTLPAAPGSEAPQAPAAPPAPKAPAAPRAPKAPERSSSDAERRLEELMERIEARMEKLEGMDEIEAVTAQMIAPNEAELERLSTEIEVAAETLAEAEMSERKGETPEASAEEIAVARQRVEELSAEIREITDSIRPSADQLRELSEKARVMAEEAAPTPEEREEIRRLTDEIVRESMPDMEELRREMRDVSRTLERDMSQGMREGLREAMMGVREGLREAMAGMREGMREARVSLRESMREASESRAGLATRSSERAERGRRSLDEAEKTHADQASEETP